MSEYFRIVRGLEVAAGVRILPGVGAPGSSADTNSAGVGSIYLESTSGQLFSKTSAGSGAMRWAVSSGGGGNLVLYEENYGSPASPAALGTNSLALGEGATTAANATNSIALGTQSLARHPGAMVYAGGRFASTGDVQTGTYILRGTTINGLTTELFLDGTGGSQRLVLPDDSTWTFTATITAHRTDASNGHAGYKIQGVVYRASGSSTIAFQGTPTKTVLAESNIPWDINIAPDPTTGAMVATVVGETGKIIRWAVLIETLEITN